MDKETQEAKNIIDNAGAVMQKAGAEIERLRTEVERLKMEPALITREVAQENSDLRDALEKSDLQLSEAKKVIQDAHRVGYQLGVGPCVCKWCRGPNESRPNPLEVQIGELTSDLVLIDMALREPKMDGSNIRKAAEIAKAYRGLPFQAKDKTTDKRIVEKHSSFSTADPPSKGWRMTCHICGGRCCDKCCGCKCDKARCDCEGEKVQSADERPEVCLVVLGEHDKGGKVVCGLPLPCEMHRPKGPCTTCGLTHDGDCTRLQGQGCNCDGQQCGPFGGGCECKCHWRNK